jgi:hypothetical protein
VIFRHNEIREELVNLAAPRDESLIRPSPWVKESEKDTPTEDTSKEKREQTAAGEHKHGDLLIPRLCVCSVDAMLGRAAETFAKRLLAAKLPNK